MSEFNLKVHGVSVKGKPLVLGCEVQEILHHLYIEQEKAIIEEMLKKEGMLDEFISLISEDGELSGDDLKYLTKRKDEFLNGEI